MSQPVASLAVALILLLPLVGAVLNAVVGRMAGRTYVNIVGPGVIFLAFLVACWILGATIGADEAHKSVTTSLWTWIDFGPRNLRVDAAFTIDPLSCLMMTVITGVGCLIHVYSVGYMSHDESPHRFFSYMNLFIFAMLVLVLAADLVILIIGWALVALASYLLIGYYYHRPSAVKAARKAFITQVIGDVALVIAAFMIVIKIGTLSLQDITDSSGSLIHAGIFSQVSSLGGGAYLTGICLLLAVGAFAKSAQFPLHTWLPDAMEGPTPVSALIHAATMVTAGVYLIARFHPLFDRAPVAQMIVATVGMGTALMAGIIALSQIDIKRVIAYSTMSQIGLMIFAVGIGAYTAGLFHFATHAVFKALLFMAAGNVIHALDDEQDIRLMGGLASRMRLTHICFLSGTLALAGFPLFAGWFSKEDLLGFGVSAGGWPVVLYVVGLVINVLTGLYAFRLWATVFRGEPQTARVYAAHEAPRSMLLPVGILALLSVGFAGLLRWPFPGFINSLGSFLDPVFHSAVSGPAAAEPMGGTAWFALVLGTVASLAGIGAALRMWEQRKPDPAMVAGRLPRMLPLLSFNKFYFDELYDRLLVQPIRSTARLLRRVVEPEVMDGWVRGTGSLLRGFSTDVRVSQTGLVRDYASYMIGATSVAVVAMLIWVNVTR